MLAIGGLEARAAFDPIAVFVAIIIILNVLSSFISAARRRAAKSGNASTPARSDTALQHSRERAAATRAAQLAKLREALATARAPQAGAGSSPARAQPPIFVATTAPTTAPPATPLSTNVAARIYSRPTAPPAADAPPSLPPATLMGLELIPSFQQIDDVGAQAAMLAVPSSAPSGQLPIVLLLGPNSGANLFIAAAIIGPCAAFRPSGHTPGGW